MSAEINIDIEEILGNVSPVKIDISKLTTGTAQARQRGAKVEPDDKLVSAIRCVGGLLQPIIVKATKDQMYEIILGQRRWGAYKILAGEDPKYSQIKSYVITRDLSEDEKKVISFIENYGRDDMEKSDYVDVIEYFYTKYGRKITLAAQKLGLTVSEAKKYLTEARLSDKIRQCINEKQFNIDTAMRALVALGDDEESVNEDQLIETAMELRKLPPARRAKVVAKMKAQDPDKKSFKQAENQVPLKTIVIKIEASEDQIERLAKFQARHNNTDESEAASEAMDLGLDSDENN